MPDSFHRTISISALVWFLLVLSPHAAPEPLKPKSATASSEQARFRAAKAIDGEVSDASRWVSDASREPAWLVVELGARQRLAGVHLFSGYGNTAAVSDFEIQMDRNGEWVTIPSAVVSGNQTTALALPFDGTMPVETSRLRLQINKTHQDIARVKELVVWPGVAGDVPPLPSVVRRSGGGGLVCDISHAEITPIYLNQSGFNAGKPKRFTAPTLADGTPFEVRPAGGSEASFTGEIHGHIGDFSAFEPSDDREYVVAAGGLVSVSFRIAPFWFERTIYQNAVNFMVDSRHYVGNDRNPCRGSFGWRDDHHFSWQLHTLVPQYISNPSAYERMPRQVAYEAPTDPSLWGELEPYREDSPDVVKLIHWGADVIVTQKLMHEHFKAQLAYFLYAWPVLERWLPQQNYERVSAYAHEHWDNPESDRAYPYDESPEHNLLALKTHIGSTKGAYPPGFSVQPNVLMHQVSLRENHPDAERYFDAARAQVEWMIANLDWDEPLVTKGQRMSEFLTMTGLAHFLRQYPDTAPAGLQQKINDWAQVMIRRSDNLWDFRRLDDVDGWTPMGERPQMWNEPGNVTGFPAALLAAREFIDADLKPRIDELVWSHVDNFSGRNPVGRHFCFRAPIEIEGVEYGWFRRYPGGIGRLRDARFVIDGAPKNPHYPHNPEIGDVGWTEGWVAFNTTLNISLSYLAWSETSLDLKRDGDELVVTLRAPLDFDPAKAEIATVVVESGQGNIERVTVTETGPSTGVFVGRVRLPLDAAATIHASYGFGYLGRHATSTLPHSHE